MLPPGFKNRTLFSLPSESSQTLLVNTTTRLQRERIGAQMSRPCHQGSKGKPPEPPTSCQSQQNQNNQVHAEKTYPKTYLIHRTMPVVRTAQVFTRCCKRDLWRFKISKVGKTCTPTITAPPLPRRFLTRLPRLRHGLLWSESPVGRAF